jgi:dienelactone hydrolase
MATLISRRSMLAAALCGIAHSATGASPAAPDDKALFTAFADRGPFPVAVADPLSLTIAQENRAVLMRVTYPQPATAPDRASPVILFSHGARASKNDYAHITDHWASHGFVTVLPTHVDSGTLSYGEIASAEVLRSRVYDMRFLLDRLDEVAAQAPGLSGRIDPEKVVAAGHSFGVLTALVLAGLPFVDNGRPIALTDARVKAVVSYNGVGPLPIVPQDWRAVTRPACATAGTADPGILSDNSLLPWRWRLGPFDLTQGKPRYAVSIASATHDFGGLIGDEPSDMPADPAALRIANAITTAFLAALFEEEQSTAAWLRRVDLPALTDARGFLERA